MEEVRCCLQLCAPALVGWIDREARVIENKKQKKQFCYQGWIKLEHVVLTRHTRYFMSVTLLFFAFKAAFGLRSCHRFNKVVENIPAEIWVSVCVHDTT